MNWAEPRPLFQTICRTCDGQRYIQGHAPDCHQPNCWCIELRGWHTRCPDCSPDLLPEVIWQPELAKIPY